MVSKESNWGDREREWETSRWGIWQIGKLQSWARAERGRGLQVGLWNNLSQLTQVFVTPIITVRSVRIWGCETTPHKFFVGPWKIIGGIRSFLAVALVPYSPRVNGNNRSHEHGWVSMYIVSHKAQYATPHHTKNSASNYILQPNAYAGTHRISCNQTKIIIIICKLMIEIKF